MKILLKEKIMQMLSSMEEAHTFLSANPEAGPSALLADCGAPDWESAGGQ